MPRVDKQCEGPGATHHFACKCREEQFSRHEARLKHAEKVIRAAIDAMDEIADESHNAGGLITWADMAKEYFQDWEYR